MSNTNKTNVDKMLSCSLDELVQMKKKENRFNRQRGPVRFPERGRGRGRGRGRNANDRIRRNPPFNRKEYRRDRHDKQIRNFVRRDGINDNFSSANHSIPNRSMRNSSKRRGAIFNNTNRRKGGGKKGNAGKNAFQNRRKVTRGNLNGRFNLPKRHIGKNMWQNTSLSRVLKAKTYAQRNDVNVNGRNNGGIRSKPILKSKAVQVASKKFKEQPISRKRSSAGSFFSPKEMSKIKIVAALDKLPAPLPGQTSVSVAMPHSYRNQGGMENFVGGRKGTLNERFG